MTEYLLSTIKNNLNSLQGETVVLAVSGGVDSMVMLDLVANFQEELQLQVVVAHVEHGLRANISKADAKFVQAKTIEYGYQFKMIELNLEQELATKKQLSLQELARQKRYQWFSEVCAEFQTDWLLTAHHRDDNIETLLMRVITGTSSKGLAGMQLVSELWGVKVMRPLLDCSKLELLQYCQTKNINWCEDATNQENKYMRNKVRNQLLPLLEQQYNPRIGESLLQLAHLAAEEDNYLEIATRIEYGKLTNELKEAKIWELQRDEWLLLHPAIQRRIIIKLIRAVSQQKHIRLSKKNIDILIAWLHELDAGGKMQLPSNIIATREANKVIFSQGELAVSTIAETALNVDQLNYLSDGSALLLKVFPDKNTAQIFVANAHLQYNKDYIFLDYDILSEARLSARSRLSGDRIRLIGMQGNKSVKKMLIEQKIARHKREKVPLILVDNDIAWVVGIRQSEFAKCSNSTRSVLCIIYYEETEGGYTDEE